VATQSIIHSSRLCRGRLGEPCGQNEKWRVNYHISESGHDSRASYLTDKPLADKAHISTSKTYSHQRDYRFDTKTFTELRNAQSITLAYDGLNPLPPMYCFLKRISMTGTSPIFSSSLRDGCDEWI
jgi:hypothetical protein